MRIKKEKINKNKKNFSLKQKNLISVKKRWVTKRKTFSYHPYVITISSYRRNMFFTAANLKGQTKIWLSAGKCGFKGRNKVAHMAVITVAETFFKKVWSFGIRRAIFKYKNFNKRRWAIKKALKQTLKRCPFKILGFCIETQIAFNGCRTKKKRRK